jgi:hypothetical protein
LGNHIREGLKAQRNKSSENSVYQSINQSWLPGKTLCMNQLINPGCLGKPVTWSNGKDIELFIWTVILWIKDGDTV